MAMDDQELELHSSSAGGSFTGCRKAVEVLTRVPKKVSYNVNKDGVKVAVLTFMKSAWRLGETVLGLGCHRTERSQGSHTHTQGRYPIHAWARRF